MNGDYMPAPAEIAAWLACLFFVVALAGGVKYLLVKERKQPVPQPLQVQYAQRLATHEELQQLRHEFESSQDMMAKQIEKLGKDNEERTRRLHERIEELPGKILQLLQSTKGLFP